MCGPPGSNLAWAAHDPAPRVRPRPAQQEVVHRGGGARAGGGGGAGQVQLVQRHRPVEDVATRQPKHSLQLGGREDLFANNTVFETWGIPANKKQ